MLSVVNWEYLSRPVQNWHCEQCWFRFRRVCHLPLLVPTWRSRLRARWWGAGSTHGELLNWTTRTTATSESYKPWSCMFAMTSIPLFHFLAMQRNECFLLNHSNIFLENEPNSLFNLQNWTRYRYIILTIWCFLGSWKFFTVCYPFFLLGYCPSFSVCYLLATILTEMGCR